MTVFDHVDLRVGDVERCRPFYDAFLRAFGFRGKAQPDGARLYYRLEDRAVREAIALIPDAGHRPNATRLAFSAASPDDVDRLAAIAQRAGARVRAARAVPRDRRSVLRRVLRRPRRQPPRNRLPLTSRCHGELVEPGPRPAFVVPELVEGTARTARASRCRYAVVLRLAQGDGWCGLGCDRAVIVRRAHDDNMRSR
jgi:catechol 2,3-dioxygenase-like lactoylglutathione lyase family enzyme